jgi:hypothetical protein
MMSSGDVDDKDVERYLQKVDQIRQALLYAIAGEAKDGVIEESDAVVDAVLQLYFDVIDNSLTNAGYSLNKAELLLQMCEAKFANGMATLRHKLDDREEEEEDTEMVKYCWCIFDEHGRRIGAACPHCIGVLQQRFQERYRWWSRR